MNWLFPKLFTKTRFFQKFNRIAFVSDSKNVYKTILNIYFLKKAFVTSKFLKFYIRYRPIRRK